MDSKKHHEIKNIKKASNLFNNKGFFFHNTLCKSYKYNAKAKLRGLTIGFLIVAAVSVLTAITLQEINLQNVMSQVIFIVVMSTVAIIYSIGEFGKEGKNTEVLITSGKTTEKEVQFFRINSFENMNQHISESNHIDNYSLTTKKSPFIRMFSYFKPVKGNMPEKIIAISASSERPKVQTLVYPDAGIDYPTSETHNPDKVLANARQALAAMDHTMVSKH